MELVVAFAAGVVVGGILVAASMSRKAGVNVTQTVNMDSLPPYPIEEPDPADWWKGSKDKPDSDSEE